MGGGGAGGGGAGSDDHMLAIYYLLTAALSPLLPLSLHSSHSKWLPTHADMKCNALKTHRENQIPDNISLNIHPGFIGVSLSAPASGLNRHERMCR